MKERSKFDPENFQHPERADLRQGLDRLLGILSLNTVNYTDSTIETDDEADLELSVINPELDQRIEEVARQLDLDFDETKYLCASRTDLQTTLSAKSDMELENVLSVFASVKQDGAIMLRELSQQDPEYIEALHTQLQRYDDYIAEKEANTQSTEQSQGRYLDQIKQAYVRSFDPQLFDDQLTETVAREAWNGRNQAILADRLSRVLPGVRENQDPKSLMIFLDYARELDQDGTRFNGYLTKANILQEYYLTHGLNNINVKGFQERIFPAIEADDPEVKAVTYRNNAWANSFGRYGIADFACRSLSTKVCPLQTYELIRAYHELPTSNYNKFEQNRQDAISLQNILYDNRGFIHDELPGVHGLLEGMQNYYESAGSTEFLQHEAKLHQLLAERLNSPDSAYYAHFADTIFDLNRYERFEFTASSDGKVKPELVIDILRRLVKNTDQNSLEVPDSDDETLRELLSAAQPWKNSETAGMTVDWQDAGRLVQFMNAILLDRQGSIGLLPSEVEQIAYTERIATVAMRGISEAEHQDILFDPYFKEIAKFQQLTSSYRKFDSAEFEQFWQGMMRVNVEDETSYQQNFARLQSRILRQLSDMSKHFNANPHTAYLTENLWSGNLSRELIGLTDTASALTLRERADVQIASAR